jgi:peptide methionine sulfoxide reductase MsrA
MFLVVFFFLRNFVQSIKIFAKMKKMTTKKAAPKKVVAKKAPVKKYEKGGEKGKKEYNEGDTKDGKQSFTTVSKGTYEKNIELVDPSAKKPYRMQVYKDGRLSNFWLTEEQARNQRAVAKKEAGYKKGGTVTKRAKATSIKKKK